MNELHKKVFNTFKTQHKEMTNYWREKKLKLLLWMLKIIYRNKFFEEKIRTEWSTKLAHFEILTSQNFFV